MCPTVSALLIWRCCKVKSWESIGCKNGSLGCTALGAVEVIVSITTLFCSRSILGYAFGNKHEQVDCVKDMSLLCFTFFKDTIQAILSGVARGCGWQHIGAYINLGSYYLVGIPMALPKRERIMEWASYRVNHAMHSATLITCSTNWEKTGS
ncbi:hypothetical protein L1987_66238 [Smallanthus sonchifolius]|uniref:Uncharacterized protein n=1 Tax=Smallanthus sonchifolius TaxID=185202 RepID=A0ACB9BWK6_9ASTR|nr:hypothetical protein L1987_66238 [Smallanthus sonchifolius]